MGSKGGGGPVRLSDVDTWKLAGFQNEFICRLMLVVDVVGGGIWEFVNNSDGPEFLKRELINNILIRRKESDTYLATGSRHRWFVDYDEKR